MADELFAFNPDILMYMIETVARVDSCSDESRNRIEIMHTLAHPMT